MSFRLDSSDQVDTDKFYGPSLRYGWNLYRELLCTIAIHTFAKRAKVFSKRGAAT